MKTEVVTMSSSYQMLYRVRYNAHYHRQYTLNNIGSSKRTTTDTTEGLLLKNLYCLECTTHSVGALRSTVYIQKFDEKYPTRDQNDPSGPTLCDKAH